MSSKLDTGDRAKLREFLCSHYNLEELKDLAFDLDTSQESNVNRQALSREMIRYCERTETLSCLIEKIISLRPNVDTSEFGKMLSKLPPRERQIVDILYERGPLAVTEICDALPVVLSGSAVRAMLKRLEDDFMGGIFELPSGKVEAGESLDEALSREVEEETGLKISGIRDYLGHFDYLSGSRRISRQLNFAVDVLEPEPVEVAEHDAYIWSALTDEPPVTEAVKAIVAKYRETQR